MQVGWQSVGQLVSWMWSWFTLSGPYFRIPCCSSCSCCSYWASRCFYACGDVESGFWQNIVVDPGKNIFMRYEHIDSISDKRSKSSRDNAQQCVGSSRISNKNIESLQHICQWQNLLKGSRSSTVSEVNILLWSALGTKLGWHQHSGKSSFNLVGDGGIGWKKLVAFTLRPEYEIKIEW